MLFTFSFVQFLRCSGIPSPKKSSTLRKASAQYGMLSLYLLLTLSLKIAWAGFASLAHLPHRRVFLPTFQDPFLTFLFIIFRFDICPSKSELAFYIRWWFWNMKFRVLFVHVRSFFLFWTLPITSVFCSLNFWLYKDIVLLSDCRYSPSIFSFPSLIYFSRLKSSILPFNKLLIRWTCCLWLWNSLFSSFKTFVYLNGCLVFKYVDLVFDFLDVWVNILQILHSFSCDLILPYLLHVRRDSHPQLGGFFFLNLHCFDEFLFLFFGFFSFLEKFSSLFFKVFF